MPISKKEFMEGKLVSAIEDEVLKFLEAYPDKAFTLGEVADGVSQAVGVNLIQDMLIFGSINRRLEELVAAGSVIKRRIDFETFYTVMKD